MSNEIAVRPLAEITEEMHSQLDDMSKMRDAFINNLMYVQQHELHREEGFQTIKEWADATFTDGTRSRSTMYLAISTAEISGEVGEVVTGKQARQLSQIPPGERKEVFDNAVEAEGGKNVTKHITGEVKARRSKDVEPPPVSTPPSAPEDDIGTAEEKAEVRCGELIEVSRKRFVEIDQMITELHGQCPNIRCHDSIQILIEECCVILRYWRENSRELTIQETDEVVNKARKKLPDLCNKLMLVLGNLRAPNHVYDALNTIREVIK